MQIYVTHMQIVQNVSKLSKTYTKGIGQPAVTAANMGTIYAKSEGNPSTVSFIQL